MDTKPKSKGPVDITKSCVTFNLNITIYTGNKTVLSLAEEIARKHGGLVEAMKGTAAAMDRNDRLSVQRIALQARAFLKEHSLSWDDNGTRLVKASEFQHVKDELVSFQAEFNKAVNKLCAGHDALVKTAKQRVGDLFEHVDFPTSGKEFKAKYSFDFTVGKLQDTDADIRIAGLSKAQAEELKQSMVTDYAAKTQRVKQEVVKRLEDVIGKMAKTLRKKQVELVDGSKGVLFRDSLIENVRELAEIAPSLNVTRSAKVADAIAAMTKLVQDTKAQDVRDDKKLRASKAKEASKIAADLRDIKW